MYNIPVEENLSKYYVFLTKAAVLLRGYIIKGSNIPEGGNMGKKGFVELTEEEMTTVSGGTLLSTLGSLLLNVLGIGGQLLGGNNPNSLLGSVLGIASGLMQVVETWVGTIFGGLLNR